MAFGPKARPFAQRRRAPGVAGSALGNRIPHKNILFVPAARPFRRNGRAAGTKRNFLCGIPFLQGCALRWANCWAFGPNTISAILQT
jgi:hypothetical protein